MNIKNTPPTNFAKYTQGHRKCNPHSYKNDKFGFWDYVVIGLVVICLVVIIFDLTPAISGFLKGWFIHR